MSIGAFTLLGSDEALSIRVPIRGGSGDVAAVHAAEPADSDAYGPQYWTQGGYDRGGGNGSNGKTSFTIDQAAAQITRTGLHWGFGALGTAATVSYAYRSTAPATMPDDTMGFTRFNEAQITATELSLKAWSDVANITFVRAGTGTTGEFAYSDSASILFSNYSSGADGAAAFAYYPGSGADSSVAGDVWVNSTLSYNSTPVLWDYGYQVLTHELGHAIGLSHPGDYNAAPDVVITYDNAAEYYEDSRQYSLMSYFGSTNTGASLPGFAAAPQLDDIAAAQRLYGANMNTRTGNTTYGFNSTADRPWFSATTGGAVPVFAVWDAGGTDTFDFSGYNQTQTIDLREGAFSSIGGSRYNVAVAKGAVIENAIGGSGADTILGNGAANVLTGGSGNDIIDGGLGADTLSGGLGEDAVAFGLATTGVFVSLQDQGIAQNTLVGSKTLTGFENIMGSNFDDALIGDSGANKIFGGAGFDRILGSDGADTLNGGAGLDWLTGGTGADTFVFSSAADTTLSASDVIFDFETGIDKIDLTTMGFAAGGTLSLANNGGNEYLYIDTNGDGTADALVNVFGRSAGTGDFTFGAVTPKFYLYGDTGADILTGSSGDDVISGGAGADTIRGGLGADLMYGGAGADTFIVGSVAESVGTDVIFDFATASDRIDVSGVVGAGGSLTIASDGTSSFLYMKQGATTSTLITYLGAINGGDLLTGGSAAPLTYYGSGSADTFTGGNAADVIAGFGGNDILIGSGGADQLYGGAGADTFKYAQISDSTLSAYDVVQDFNRAEGDKVDLTAVHTHGAGDSYQIQTFGGSTFVYVDIGNDGTQDMLVLLSGVTGVTSADILF